MRSLTGGLGGIGEGDSHAVGGPSGEARFFGRANTGGLGAHAAQLTQQLSRYDTGLSNLSTPLSRCVCV